VEHVGEHYEDPRGWGRERNTHYDRGFADGLRARPAAFSLSLRHWRFMIAHLHPDRFERQPDEQVLANEVLKWLNANRPPDLRQ
jgi:hypothetical protein